MRCTDKSEINYYKSLIVNVCGVNTIIDSLANLRVNDVHGFNSHVYG